MSNAPDRSPEPMIQNGYQQMGRSQSGEPVTTIGLPIRPVWVSTAAPASEEEPLKIKNTEWAGTIDDYLACLSELSADDLTSLTVFHFHHLMQAIKAAR